MLFAGPLLAQEDRYRVEVIVLTHLHHGEDAREVLAIENYSESVDFLTPVPEPYEPEAPATEQPAAEEVSIDPLTQEGLLPAEEPEADPNAVLQVEEKSDAMADAWRRLRLSAPFRPLQYLSWEQGSAEPFPRLRVHDLDLLMVDDPWEDVRLRMETDELIERFSRDEELLAETGQPLPEEPTASELLPPPSLYYRLDGTVSLVRKRFLHLYIDMQQRELAPIPQPMQDDLSLLSSAPDTFETTVNAEAETAEPDRYNVFDFEQNRQVKTARLEYFDGPVLSVLAYITPVASDEDEN